MIDLIPVCQLIRLIIILDLIWFNSWLTYWKLESFTTYKSASQFIGTSVSDHGVFPLCLRPRLWGRSYMANDSWISSSITGGRGSILAAGYGRSSRPPSGTRVIRVSYDGIGPGDRTDRPAAQRTLLLWCDCKSPNDWKHSDYYVDNSNELFVWKVQRNVKSTYVAVIPVPAALCLASSGSVWCANCA